MSNPNKYSALGDARRHTAADADKASQEAYNAWNMAKTNGESQDDAFDQAMKERRVRHFGNMKDDFFDGAVQGRRAFVLANQIRQARMDFDAEMANGSVNEEAYKQLVSDREDALQDVLIKYGDSITSEQQDFIIDFSGGEYNDLLDDTTTTPSASGSRSDNTDSSAESVDDEEVIYGPHEVYGPHLVESVDAPEDGDPNWTRLPRNRFEDTYSDNPMSNPGDTEGSHDSQSRIGIDTLLEDIDPELLSEYNDAYSDYVAAHANASYADFGAALSRFSGKEGSWIRRKREQIAEKFNTSGHQRRTTQERFYEVLGVSLNAIIDERMRDGSMTEAEINALRMELDSDAAYQLQRSISSSRIALDIERNEKKTIVGRRMSQFIGISGAVIAGAATAVIDGQGKGDNHLQWLTVGTIAGAVAGYGAWKRAERGDTGDAEARAVEARNIVQGYYEDDAVDGPMATNATEYMTNAWQDRNRAAAGKRTMGTAAVAWGTHLGVDALSSAGLTNMNLVGLGTESAPEPTASQAVESTAAPTETMTPKAAPTEIPTAAPTETVTVPPVETPVPTESITDLTVDNEPAKPVAAPPAETAPSIESIDTPEAPEVIPGGVNPEVLSNMTFDIEPGHGVTQELAQTYDSLGLPVPSPLDLDATVTEAIDILGPDGIYQDITLELSPDGSEYWIPEPTKNAQYTPQFIQFMIEQQLGS